ncbi:MULTISPECIES: ATP-binding protein [Staphylococcus]|uniref:ATP-binding protein n=1 Tax=Staphylococcus TaxID=1279 RepID=UPI000763DCD0|nr:MULTISPECIES: ATP-binding protein [Staphylococcus]AVO02327.1 DNA replication protein DnaC [Staphylococcus simulans]AVO05273.1 DNA replication protein DnaC [Staphylococcus simulans]AWG18876.1 DNA replication protein DnaC [Staphylococcus simulans]AWI01823.1 DNA replication protein DnaC [Staphylococcus simulans]KXA42153.1 IstB-like ATP-binding protein [Staphylococcus simulans]
MRKLFNLQLKKKLKKYEAANIEYGLYCEKCGNKYDLHQFESGYEFRDGCECKMIEAGKLAEKQRKQKAVNRIFRQSTVNASIKDATVRNYKPKNKDQEKAKSTAIEYVKTFSTDNPKSLILQGSYGTGKSHLAYAIAKAVKKEGYSVAFMHIPMLMERIKATYNRESIETTDELVKLLSSIDLLVLDDVGVENTEHTLNKLFSIVDNRTGKNNIFTTNFSDKELNQNMNWQRINSRMKHNARTVRMLGDDYRERNSW